MTVSNERSDMETQSLIAYARVSTQRQGQSGLGLESQQAAIAAYAASAKGQILATYVEVESGRKADRPELAKALAHAKRAKAKLVIAKLDRLARNVYFLAGLMESGVDFVACDNPTANRLTIHILAAVAEDEAIRISQRTKAALAAAKARGVLLGSSRQGHWQNIEQKRREGALRGSEAARAKREAQTKPLYASVLPTVKHLRESGESLQAIADHLNNSGHFSATGLNWNRVQIHRLLKSAAA